MQSYKTTQNRKYSGSPTFTQTLSSISPSEFTILDFHQNATQQEKYAPFNRLTIINTASVPIKVYPNQNSSNSYVVPAGVIREFDKKSIPALWSLKVENLSSTTATGDDNVTIEYQKEVIDQEKIVENVASRLFRVGDTI